MSEIPNLVMVNNPPSIEPYVMECMLEVSKHEVLGDAQATKTCKWSGFASLEVVSKMLAIMEEVVSE